MTKPKILPAIFIFILAAAASLFYSLPSSEQRASRGIASVDDNSADEDSADEAGASESDAGESDEPSSALPSESSVTKYMTPQAFLSSLTQIPATAEPRPAALSSVAVSFVPSDSIYYANGVNYNLGGATALQTAKIRKLVLSEFQMYPSACLQRLGLRHLIFSADINIAQDGTVQERTATLDAPNGIMTYADTVIIDRPRNIYLDYIDNVARVEQLARSGRSDEAFNTYLAGERRSLETRRRDGIRSVRAVISNIHHEFFHYFDIRDDNSLTDTEWAALNEPGFLYGAGGRFARTTDVINWDNTHPGFLNGYARSGVDEDKAEIWGALMGHPFQLQELMDGDRIIARKVALTKRRAEIMCPELNADFWERVRRTHDARMENLMRIMRESDEAVSAMSVPGF